LFIDITAFLNAKANMRRIRSHAQHVWKNEKHKHANEVTQ